MKRKCLHASPCAIARALDSIGDWWTLLILRDAFKGVTRFNAIQKSLGIPRNILTTRLRMLVKRDILSIGPASDGSMYREYVLTDKGRDLVPVLVALRQWGERHLSTMEDGAGAAIGLRDSSQVDNDIHARRDAVVVVMTDSMGDVPRVETCEISEDELADALDETLMPSSGLHIEAGRFIGPMPPRVAY